MNVRVATTQSHRGAYLSIVIARRPQADAAIYAEVPLATSRWIAPVDLGAAARPRDDEEGGRY